MDLGDDDPRQGEIRGDWVRWARSGRDRARSGRWGWTWKRETMARPAGRVGEQPARVLARSGRPGTSCCRRWAPDPRAELWQPGVAASLECGDSGTVDGCRAVGPVWCSARFAPGLTSGPSRSDCGFGRRLSRSAVPGRRPGLPRARRCQGGTCGLEKRGVEYGPGSTRGTSPDDETGRA